MTRFTKATLIISAFIIATIATAALVVRAYHFRGYFSIGGEWLFPAICAAARGVIKEVKNLYSVAKNDSEAHGNGAE